VSEPAGNPAGCSLASLQGRNARIVLVAMDELVGVNGVRTVNSYSGFCSMIAVPSRACPRRSLRNTQDGGTDEHRLPILSDRHFVPDALGIHGPGSRDAREDGSYS